LFAVGLFDAIREKASELLSGATEKVGDLAGDLPGVQDLSQSATDAAGEASEQVAGTAQDLGATATDVSGSVTDAVTDSLPDVPPEVYRP
jgi:hypothetical protein